MRPASFRPHRPAAIFAIGILAAAPSVQAALLVYEGFNGYGTAGTALATQNANGNTIGLTGAYGGNGNASVGVIAASGISFGSLQTSGSALTIPNNTVVIGGTLSLASSYSGTLWSSYLVRFNAPLSTTGGNGMEIRISDSISGTTNARFRVFADTRSGTPNVIGSDYNTADLSGIGNSSDPALLTGTTSPSTPGTDYLLISSFTNAGTGVVGSGVATTWALTLAQFETMMSSGIPVETYLADATLGQYYAKATNTDTELATDTFENGDNLQIVSVGDNVTLDEIRFGTSLADVLPVPEPTSALLGFASLGLATLRRKRGQQGS